MAKYVIVNADNTSGWTDEPAMRFSYRHYSKSGQRIAQEVFDKLRKTVAPYAWQRYIMTRKFATLWNSFPGDRQPSRFFVPPVAKCLDCIAA